MAEAVVQGAFSGEGVASVIGHDIIWIWKGRDFADRTPMACPAWFLELYRCFCICSCELAQTPLNLTNRLNPPAKPGAEDKQREAAMSNSA
jgi:hypothetical protein